MTGLTNNAKACIALIEERDAFGQAHYPAGMDRTDLSPEQWMQHAVEEMADQMNYIMKLKHDLPALLAKAYQRGFADGRRGPPRIT
jgi:hypothetical protein